MKSKHPTVQVANLADRSWRQYTPGQEPYRDDDKLSQKLWSVATEEFGPNVADVLADKLHQAVVDHVAKTGETR